MPEILDQSASIESATISVDRTAATVKGGRRFSFGALVVVGDRRGKVGFGYGKSNEVPSAVEKAQKYARRDMKPVPMVGTTIPHQVEGSFSASKVRLIPASPGTGVVAGGTVRAILEMAGLTDCITKCYGSTNKRNIVKAVFAGLSQLRQAEQVAAVRGQDLGKTEIQVKIERGMKFMPSAPKREKMRGPVNTISQERKGRPSRRPRRDQGASGASGSSGVPAGETAAPAGDAGAGGAAPSGG